MHSDNNTSSVNNRPRKRSICCFSGRHAASRLTQTRTPSASLCICPSAVWLMALCVSTLPPRPQCSRAQFQVWAAVSSAHLHLLDKQRQILLLILKQHIISCHIFLLRLKTLRVTKTAFLTQGFRIVCQNMKHQDSHLLDDSLTDRISSSLFSWPPLYKAVECLTQNNPLCSKEKNKVEYEVRNAALQGTEAGGRNFLLFKIL